MTLLQEMTSIIEAYSPKEIARILIDLGIVPRDITNWIAPAVDKEERDAVLQSRGFNTLAEPRGLEWND